VADSENMATIPKTIPVGGPKPLSRPKKPYPSFPLFANQNGQWCKKVKGKPYYFGSWKDDLKGEQALQDWRSREESIRAGLDNLRTQSVEEGMTLMELSTQFLADRRTRLLAGDLAASTYGDYLRECMGFVAETGKDGCVASLAPAHFQAFADTLVKRKLGRHSRKRIIAYIKAMLNWGANNGYYPRPTYGTGFAVPDTSPDAMRQARARAGEPDYSGRVATGGEITKLLNASSAMFKGVILVAVNCGLGPADLGRLRWRHIDMKNGELRFPRGKTGVARKGYLWKKTRKVLEGIAKTRCNREALAKQGQEALVFITRENRPLYREFEIIKDNVSVGVRRENAVSSLFAQRVRELKLDPGLTFYRLRHTFKTLGKRAKDRDALNLMMGHKEGTTGAIYDHEEISADRIRRVAMAVLRGLWPKPKNEKTRVKPGEMRLVG
jgi:integrase